MWISNKPTPFLAACALALVAPLHADDLTLAGGAARLSGTVRSIDAEGVVELASPLSPEPLRLKGGAVEKVEFSGGAAEPEPPAAMLVLANGDLLPASIEGMDDRALTVVSPEAGRLEIPRDRLVSVQLGVRRLKMIYSGPGSLEDWVPGGDGAKNWDFEKGALVAKGPAAASRKVALPRKFILRFTLKWQAREVPNFQFSFADPLRRKGEPSDRYYLQFNGAGLEIKREASKGNRYSSIATLNRTPNQYPERRLQVEIRVDRANSRLALFLNGEPEGDFIDHIPAPPDGSGLALVCNSPEGGGLEIRDIQILEFDEARGRHRAEERGDPKTDGLISREDDRWSGRLMDIRKTGEGAVFRFKSDFQDEPLEIPEADVSTVFFAVSGAAADGGSHPFVLKLRGEGSLRVASCRFSDATVSAVHPLLGPLELRREGVVAMERTRPDPAAKPESAPGK